MANRSTSSGLATGTGMARMASVVPVPGLLRDLGHDPAQVLADLRFPSHLFDDPENRVPVALLSKLLGDCARVTDCPHFGLLVGERCGTATLGKVGFIAKYSNDVGAALSALAANIAHVQDAAIVSLLVRGPHAMLGFMLKNPDTPGADHAVDLCMAWGTAMLRELCGTAWRPTEVQLSHQPRPDLQPFRRVFGGPVRFNAEQNALQFESRWLAHRIAHADPGLTALMLRDIRPASDGVGKSLTAQVRDIIRPAIGANTPPATEVARILGLHSRTLHRRLAAERTSYRGILDETRHNVARQMLRETQLPIGQVASLLGFDEASAFTRAFRRWAGTSPAEWRRQATRKPSD